MNISQQNQIESTLVHLFNDSKYDMLKAMKGMAKSAFRPVQPADLKNVYLSISKEQGEDLVALIKNNNIQNIVEFGTSFGISALYLALGALQTKGSIITTELIESKAEKAIENFKLAGVNELIEVRVGNALETLKDHNYPIDLLLLDGWKDLYLPLFQMLEHTYHKDTIIYVDNADMAQTQVFLKTISRNEKYKFESIFGGKAVLVTIK